MALLALTALGAKNGMPPAIILLLPLVFGSGMAFIDTANGMMMLWAYKFALMDPARRVFFNLFLTLASAQVALLVAVIEVLGCLQTELTPGGPFWAAVATLNEHFEYLGYGIIGFFGISIMVAVLIFKRIFPGENVDDAASDVGAGTSS